MREDLGNDAFDVVDHWDADPCAVGVAPRNDHGFLVYISSLSTTQGVYAYQCECPPTGEAVPYDADPMVETATYAELLDAVRSHVAR